MENLMQYVSMIILVVAVICTLVSVVTQFIKELPYIKEIPTQLVVVALTEVICILAFAAYASYIGMAVRWYYIIAVIFAGFIIAYITANGWDAFITLFKRFYKKDVAEEIRK